MVKEDNFHFFDFTLANAWIEYRDIHRICRTPIVDLIGFRENFVETLLKTELPNKRSSFGCSRSDAEEIEPPAS